MRADTRSSDNPYSTPSVDPQARPRPHCFSRRPSTLETPKGQMNGLSSTPVPSSRNGPPLPSSHLTSRLKGKKKKKKKREKEKSGGAFPPNDRAGSRGAVLTLGRAGVPAGLGGTQSAQAASAIIPARRVRTARGLKSVDPAGRRHPRHGCNLE